MELSIVLIIPSPPEVLDCATCRLHSLLQLVVRRHGVEEGLGAPGDLLSYLNLHNVQVVAQLAPNNAQVLQKVTKTIILFLDLLSHKQKSLQYIYIA